MPKKYNKQLTYQSKTNITEEFREVNIEGYGNITINNLGTKIFTKTGKSPPIYEDEYGYLGCYIGLYKKTHHFLRLHRMVALAFLENPNNLPEVNHIDCNKKNNCLNNLEWVTTKENNRHARENGLIPNNNGIKNGRAKLTDNQVLEIRKKYTGVRGEIAELAREYCVSWSLIKLVVTNKNWTHI